MSTQIKGDGLAARVPLPIPALAAYAATGPCGPYRHTGAATGTQNTFQAAARGPLWSIRGGAAGGAGRACPSFRCAFLSSLCIHVGRCSHRLDARRGSPSEPAAPNRGVRGSDITATLLPAPELS